VQKNIAAFGGDSKNVTLFGESAGGEDILALMTIPSARGLFAKAIVQSGGGWMRLPSLPEAEAEGGKIVAGLGVGSTATAAQLRNIPLQSLVNVALSGDGLGRLVVDGRLLALNPTQVFAQGEAAHVPLIIGSNSYEGSLLDMFDVKPSEVLSGFNADELTRARAIYGAGADDSALAHALFRDFNFAGPARWIARRCSVKAPVFLYRFSYIRERQTGRVPGASHGSEIPYVFDSWQQAPMQGAFLRPRDRAEVTILHNFWVAFARTSVPEYPGSPAWPAYRTSSDELMEFGTEGANVRASESSTLDFIERKGPS
jgi:para-nitrobenzyl esterase